MKRIGTQCANFSMNFKFQWKVKEKKVHNTTLHPSRSSALKRAWQLSGVKALLSYLSRTEGADSRVDGSSGKNTRMEQASPW